jgi:hypothetical protein
MELHWDLPLEIMEVHELWHRGRHTPSTQTYVTVATTGLSPCLFGTKQESAGPAMNLCGNRSNSAFALIAAVKPPVRDL